MSMLILTFITILLDKKIHSRDKHTRIDWNI